MHKSFDNIFGKKENIVVTINIRDAIIVGLGPRQRFFLDQTTSMELHDMERQNIEPKRIVEATRLRIDFGPEKENKNKVNLN